MTDARIRRSALRSASDARRPRPPFLVWALLLAGMLPRDVPNRTMTAAAPSLPSADSVLARYYRAIGGLDRLLGVATRRMWGTYTEGAMVARTDIAWKRPDARRVNVHAPGFDYSEGFDGRTWEYSFQTQHLVVDTGAAADAGRRGAEFDESFVAAGRKGHQVSVLGVEDFAGHPAFRVRVILADGWVKEYLFDQVSGLILAMRKAMPIHATGPAVESLTSYEDWRPTNRLLQPYRFVERETGTGRLLTTLQWDSIRTNVSLNPEQIGRPHSP